MAEKVRLGYNTCIERPGHGPLGLKREAMLGHCDFTDQNGRNTSAAVEP